MSRIELRNVRSEMLLPFLFGKKFSAFSSSLNVSEWITEHFYLLRNGSKQIPSFFRYRRNSTEKSKFPSISCSAE
jgi:hypothetical protein